MLLYVPNDFDVTTSEMKAVLLGLAIGDALGACHEFVRATPKIPYSGVLSNVDQVVQFQFQKMAIPASSVTDDTQMTIALLSVLKRNLPLADFRIFAVDAYMKWANDGNPPLGRNTRALFKGVKTFKGYKGRVEKHGLQSQSNGSLMRASAFALPELKERWQAFSDADVSLTNDTPVNREASRIYISVLRNLLYDEPLQMETKVPEIVEIFSQVDEDILRDVSGKTKGWVCHALYVGLMTLKHAESFENGMDFIAENFLHGTDTDTIMAVSGALLGAKFGLESMMKEERTFHNIIQILNKNDILDRAIREIVPSDR